MPRARGQRDTYDAEEMAEFQRRHAAWVQQHNGDSIRAQPALADLRERLLAVGGEEVVLADGEPYLVSLFQRGTSFGKHSRVRRGIPHRCYHNAAELWHTSGGQLKIAVGYALWGSQWDRHAWAVAPLEKPPVIETTRKRDLYYGIVLTDDEAEDFYKDEWISYQAEP